MVLSTRKFVTAILLLTIVAMVQGTFQVRCDFGKSSQGNLSYTAIGDLTPHFGDARSCRIKHDASSGILRVHLSKQNQNISVIYAVVMEKQEITFVGTARSVNLMLGNGYHFHSCPEKTDQTQLQNTELGLFIFGAPENATFKLEVNLDNTYLSPGETKSIKVQKNGLAQVLAFDVLKKDLFKLLQVTVTSNDETISYLVVSKSCSDVQQLGQGITAQSILAKELKLTFSKSGRITLSQYSSPKIETGRWYIGVLVKEGSVDNIEEKAVNVSITQTYSYDTIGKGLPVLYMCLVTGFFGLLIAVFAHFFLNSDFEEMSPPFYVEEEVQEQDNETSSHSQRFPDRTILDFIPPPIPRRSFPVKCWVKVVVVHWFGRGTKTYSYLTVVLAVSFLVGSAQFVIGRWSNMNATGNRDQCYYNELCYRPIAVADLPSNFLVSNVPYCLHGIILALAFSFREAVNLNYLESQASFNFQGSQTVPYDFSLAYALSWALVFEGLFSATYHLCPSRLTFQFDSAFMFIISGLVVVALFNARIDKIRSSEGRHPSETIVQAPKYFLFFVAPLLVLNYIGSIRDTEGLPRFVEIFYWIVLVLWLVVVYVWAFKKVGISCTSGSGLMDRIGCATWEDRVKWFWMIMVPICLLIIGVAKWSDWSQFFLFSCVAAVVLTIGGLISFNLIVSFKRLKYQSTYHSLDSPQPCCDMQRMCLVLVKNPLRILYIVALLLFWVFAMYFFKLKPTARKTALPSVSRTYNQECVLLEFFDYHDIWHMLSSVALLMSAFMLIYITRSVEKYFWVDASYWYNKMKNRDQITVRRNVSTPSLDEGGHHNKEIELDDRRNENGANRAVDEGKVILRNDSKPASEYYDHFIHRTSRARSRPESLV